jgi:phosphate transport system ATP-binding protein
MAKEEAGLKSAKKVTTTRPSAAGAGKRGEGQPASAYALELNNVEAFYGNFRAVAGVSLKIAPKSVTAFIGPSGCGKSTLLRVLNRMHETLPGTSVKGQTLLDGVDLYGPNVDPVRARRLVGMVFQKPNPFPTMSIFENVISGLRLAGVRSKSELEGVAETSLRKAALWNEVKDKLGEPGTSLSGGQQQRLCIARTIAVKPEIVLMDEPCSALDPVATLKVEELVRELAVDYTIVIVTHNMQQASRVSNTTAFFSMNEQRAGYLVEMGATNKIFTNPKEQLTSDYVAGRFG